MKLIKKFSVQLLILMLIVITSGNLFVDQVNAAPQTSDPLSLKASAAILIDADSGQILYEKNADELLGVASMSKMMTEYLLLEAIKNGKVTWDQEVTISNYVHRLSAVTALSNIGLSDGKKYTVRQLYQAMAIYSANAASVAIAEVIAGSEKDFVTLMNQKAETLGLKNYKFVNCTGLNNEDLLGQIAVGAPSDENLMSANAVAKVAYNLLKDFPEVLDTASIPKLKFVDGKEYISFNWMLPGLAHDYLGVDGLKTGSTNFAGACFTATAKRGDQRYISVVMKSETKNSRFEETKKLLDYAFTNFEKREVFPINSKIIEQEDIPIAKGKLQRVSISSKKPISIVVNKSADPQYSLKFLRDEEPFDKKGRLVAPFSKDESLGHAVIVDKDGNEIKFIHDHGSEFTKTDVGVDQDVKKANIFVLIWRAIVAFFQGLF